MFCFSRVLSLLFLFLFVSLAHGQLEGIGNTTSTPIAGVPHDYIGGLNDIVNPANGALSVRIQQSRFRGNAIQIGPFMLSRMTLTSSLNDPSG